MLSANMVTTYGQSYKGWPALCVAEADSERHHAVPANGQAHEHKRLPNEVCLW